MSLASKLEIRNTTMAKNKTVSGGGGIHANGGELTLRNVTLAENAADSRGGGLFLETPLTALLINTIIANSASGNNCGGTALLIASSSLSSDNTCALIGATNKLNTDPMLNPLGNYGGPTLTYLPAQTRQPGHRRRDRQQRADDRPARIPETRWRRLRHRRGRAPAR